MVKLVELKVVKKDYARSRGLSSKEWASDISAALKKWQQQHPNRQIKNIWQEAQYSNPAWACFFIIFEERGNE